MCISAVLVSAIHLLSGMLLLSRYEPENCPALLTLFCLIKSVARVEHMTESCLGASGTNDITDPQYLVSFHTLLFFTMEISVVHSILYRGIVHSFLFVFWVFCKKFVAFNCTTSGRKLLASS